MKGGTRRRFGAIRELPSGRFQARYPDGAGKHRPAPRTFATKGEAEQWLAMAETDQMRGTFIDPQAGKVTVDAWSEEWLRTKRGQRANTLARDRAALAYLTAELGHYRLSAVTPRHIQSVLDSMAHLSGTSRKTYLATFAALFNAAVEADLLAKSPVRRSLGVARSARRDRPTLTPEELLRLADTVPARYAALVLVGGVLGLRWSEAIGLRIKDIDFLRRTIAVVQTVEEVAGKLTVTKHTKTAASRRTMTAPVFVVDALADHLAHHRVGAEGDSLVFVGERECILRRAWGQRVLRPAVARAGLPATLTFHGLRHSATSLMVTSGEHPRVIQARLGHADPALSMAVYAHVPTDLDRSTALHLDEMFRSHTGTELARSPLVALSRSA